MVARLLLFVLIILLAVSCRILPTAKERGIKYFTKSKFVVPQDIKWIEVGSAKEIINVSEKLVLLSGGSNPIPLDKWRDFEVGFSWKKNIDRNILFNKTAFIRSPNAKSNCQGKDCFIQREYKGYTWIELAKPLAIDYIPSKTNIMKPAKGHLVVKTIKKCQIVVFENEIYQLTDNKGNYYVMHATEKREPNLNVVLPVGWTLNKVKITKPLVVTPSGLGEDCFFNIIGDHLGQGYHQYIYADEYYPSY